MKGSINIPILKGVFSKSTRIYKGRYISSRCSSYFIVRNSEDWPCEFSLDSCVGAMVTLEIISGEGSFELGPSVQEINGLLHRNVAPVAHFQHSLHVGDGKEGPTGLEMYLQGVL